MSIKVLFFASLREQLGQDHSEVAWQADLTAAQVWCLATGQARLPEQVLMACNQEYCQGDSLIADGAEVAFFPPVTGG
ncbi:MAG TPA: molybdopterin converting factor subunit 1 [Thiolinea sp.]|nr:molybdopterin converting factor subunit 1 [Thiolinea sp.]